MRKANPTRRTAPRGGAKAARPSSRVAAKNRAGQKRETLASSKQVAANHAPPNLGIGARLRHARLMRGARMKDIAEAAGCSESLVSKIENNKLEPSLQVLSRLCGILGINLRDLFSPEQHDDTIVTRNTQRSVVEMDPLRQGHGIMMERVIPYARGHLLQSNIHVVAPGGSSFGMISHEGEEVGYIISGEIELFVGDKTFKLAAGDTFCFRSEIGHGYRNCGPGEARILFVNTPPTF
jgi:transcriptional regulator with XRE-family HTH domain